MKKAYLLIIILLNISAYSQEKCKVLKRGIDSIYLGGCKKGFAHGFGEAWGKDYYAGAFKNGYPHGKGIMKFQDGSIYNGSWRKGNMDGEGKLSFKKNGKDTIINATWRKNEIVVKALENVDYKITKEQTPERLKVYRFGEGNIVHYKISALNISNLFISGSSGIEFNYPKDIGFKDIVFPFYAKIRFETWNSVMTQRIQIEVEVELIKQGEWTIDIR